MFDLSSVKGFSRLVLCHFKYYMMNKRSFIVGLIFQNKTQIQCSFTPQN